MTAASYSIEHRLLFVGSILLLGIVAALLARRLRLPVLVLFLGVGMFLGSDGPGNIYFDDADLARSIGIVGLVAILFEGGLTSEWRHVKRVLPSAVSLATVGVLVTAAIVGVTAYGLFDLTWTGALLIGATVASTGCGRRLRSPPLHGRPPAARERAGRGVRPQRPPRSGPDDRPDLVDHESGLRLR